MAAKDFEDRIRFGSLYEIYGALLTDRQQTCLRLYFYEDYSLGEIAGELKVSRQAVSDLLKRVEQTLEEYEKLLGFLQKQKREEALLEEALGLVKKIAGAAVSPELERVSRIINELMTEGR